MKITDIKCYVLEHSAAEIVYRWRDGLPVRGDGPPGTKVQTSILKVETEEGITGSAGSRHGQYVASLVERRLKYFIGLDPLLTENLWHRIWEVDRVEEFQVHTIGMLDLACWDIKSQAAGMPVYKMLGGNNPKVPAYASTVTWDTLDEYERHIKEAMDEGFTAFKLHAWGRPKDDAILSRKLREWTGVDADLMFDGSAGWDYATSLKFGRVLEDLGFLWYEEPIREFDIPSYAELCRSLDIPVLAAETSDGCHWNAATWIQYRALDMMRVSSAFKGGITGAIKVAHLAESFGMRAQVHGGGHANLQICAAIPNNDYFEALIVDTDQIRGLKNQRGLNVVEGFITASETPGIGVQPDWAELEKRAVRVV